MKLCTFLNKLIQRQGLAKWAPRLSDLIIFIDFFLCGHLKSVVYKQCPRTILEVKENWCQCIKIRKEMQWKVLSSCVFKVILKINLNSFHFLLHQFPSVLSIACIKFFFFFLLYVSCSSIRQIFENLGFLLSWNIRYKIPLGERNLCEGKWNSSFAHLWPFTST